VAHAREEPEWLTRHLELATLLFIKGDRAACTAEFEKMARVHPEEPALLFDLGACREGMGDLAGAQACYRRAFALPGASPELQAMARHDWGATR
jgi:Flp pilus assembly protein TadD